MCVGGVKEMGSEFSKNLVLIIEAKQMKQWVLVKNGEAEEAFELQEAAAPKPAPGEVLIAVESFGLNYADVMSRLGLYNDAPPLPAVLGYEVVGRVAELGEGITDLEKGQKVLAFTRFGGYAQFRSTPRNGVVPISEDLPNAQALALATQYTTAYFAAMETISLRPEDIVLVHAAAGGVGTALIQLAKMKGCTVIGTVGSDKKMAYIKETGADHAINYRKEDFAQAVPQLLKGERLDVVFDPIGGKSVKKGLKLLGSGGRMVTYGASTWSNTRGGFIDKIRLAWGFGFLHPLGLMMKSKTVAGVNMLPMGDNKPKLIQRCLTDVVALAEQGKVTPRIGAEFPAAELPKAHALLQSRDSVGKIALKW